MNLNANMEKGHCCMTSPLTSISSTVSSTAVVAAAAAMPTTGMLNDWNNWTFLCPLDRCLHMYMYPPPPRLLADLSREQWYVHHTPTHPQHQLTEEFVMYAPALPTSSSSTSSPIGKFGIESSTESYLNSRYSGKYLKSIRLESR